MEEQNKKLSITLPPDVAEGTYANLALIAHSGSEFILDFIRAMPGIQQPTVKSRVIMTPENVKKLLKALQENVANYEAQFGPIECPKPVDVPFGFGGGKGEA